MFYKWLVQLTICIHWFNPFVYLIARETFDIRLSIVSLFCCAVLLLFLVWVYAFSLEKGKREYGNTLLNMANTEKKFKNSIVSVTLNEGKKLLKD